MTYDKYMENAEVGQVCTGSCYKTTVPKYDWMYINNNYSYWLGTPSNDSSSFVWDVFESDVVGTSHVNDNDNVVRPAIVHSKASLD